jgi:hypothetical protein
MAYDPVAGEFSWQPIQRVVRFPYCDTAYHLVGDSTDQLVTRAHRCLVEREGSYVFVAAQDAARERQARVPILENLPSLLATLPVPYQGTSGPSNGQAFNEGGSCASHGSRSDQQPVEQSGIISQQQRTQAVRGDRFTTSDMVRISAEHYRGIAWCITVKGEAFVARRNGQIFVTGNSGFPKSKNVALAIDKGEGHPNRGRAIPTASTYQACDTEQENKLTGNPVDDYEAVTDEAKKWDGWGTAMKPSHEPLVVARKPLIGTVAANVLEHGTGALNIDACRVVTNGEKIQVPQSDPTKRAGVVGTDLGISGARIDDFQAAQAASVERTNTLGRWPPNLLLSHAEGCVQVGERVIKGQEGDESIPVYDCAPNCPVAEMDRQSGEHDTGGASRFFPVFKYQPKAGKSERNEGLDVGLLCSRCTSALKVGSFMDDADRATSKGLSPTKVRGKCADCGREVMQQDESVRVMAGNSHP